MKHAPEVVGIVLIVVIAGAVLLGVRWFNAAAVVVTISRSGWLQFLNPDHAPTL